MSHDTSISFNLSRWGVGRFSQEDVEDVLVLNEGNISDYLEENVVKDLLKVANILSEMEIPGHLSLILILIIIFSRDGITMEGQVSFITNVNSSVQSTVNICISLSKVKINRMCQFEFIHYICFSFSNVLW